MLTPPLLLSCSSGLAPFPAASPPPMLPVFVASAVGFDFVMPSLLPSSPIVGFASTCPVTDMTLVLVEAEVVVLVVAYIVSPFSTCAVHSEFVQHSEPGPRDIF